MLRRPRLPSSDASTVPDAAPGGFAEARQQPYVADGQVAAAGAASGHGAAVGANVVKANAVKANAGDTGATGAGAGEATNASENQPRHLPGLQAPGRQAPGLSGRLKLGPGGRVVIPADMREAMGLNEGDVILASYDRGQVTLVPQKLALKRAQEELRRYLPNAGSLADQLIAERRREAALKEEPGRGGFQG